MENIRNDYPHFIPNLNMDLVTQLRAFVTTAQTGSFTAAADRLGTSNRLTSKYVAELEARLGVRLFQRTTRKVGLTPAGEVLLARVPFVLEDLDGLLSEVAEGAGALSGPLRITAPVTFGEMYLAGMLARFADIHPGVTIDLRLDDRFADLAAEGIDLAFRLGHFDLAALKVRHLGRFRSVLVATPDYLRRHGAPETPEELSRHACIVDTNRRLPRSWVFTRDGTEATARIDGKFQVNSASGAAVLAQRGLGIAYLPHFAVQEALGSGTLVEVMTAFEGESGPVGAVYLEGRTLPRKVRALIDFARADIRASGFLLDI
jgi:DNA-binding transcriptional LysR family regulator